MYHLFFMVIHKVWEKKLLIKYLCPRDFRRGEMEKIMKNKNSIPKLYERKEECCGCTACYSICPQCAIIMEEDEEGFIYPLIDEKKCIRCKLCLKVCPIKYAQNKRIIVD